MVLFWTSSFTTSLQSFKQEKVYKSSSMMTKRIDYNPLLPPLRKKSSLTLLNVCATAISSWWLRTQNLRSSLRLIKLSFCPKNILSHFPRINVIKFICITCFMVKSKSICVLILLKNNRNQRKIKMIKHKMLKSEKVNKNYKNLKILGFSLSLRLRNKKNKGMNSRQSSNRAHFSGTNFLPLLLKTIHNLLLLL